MAFQQIRQLFRAKAPRWHFAIAIFASIAALRYFGLLQGSELFAFDFFLKHRFSAEGTESEITIIGIDDDYLEQVLSDTENNKIVELIDEIYDHEPAIVGLDFLFSQPIEAEMKGLLKLFDEEKTLIGSRKILPPNPIAPLIKLPQDVVQEQIGFNDFPVDRADERVRRTFIGVSEDGSAENFRESFSYKVARLYLEQKKGLEAFNGESDPKTIMFGQVEVPRILNNENGQSNYGGYITEEIDGIQTLINFRNSERPFKVITATKFMQGEFSATDVQGHIVLIGGFNYETTRSLQSIVAYNSLIEETSGENLPVYGIEFQAHAISQLINAALNNRAMLWSLPEWGEYLILLAASVAGFLIGKFLKSSTQGVIVLGLASVSITALSYLGLAIWGVWLPIVPAFLSLSITGITYIAFYHSERSWQVLVQERDRALKALSDERRRTVEWAFATIHSGPLQTLSDILRHVRDRQHNPSDFLVSLEALNREIRQVGEHLRQEIINPENSLYLSQGVKLNLIYPLHELFYEVYHATLERNYPGFKTIKIRTVAFDSIDEQYLTIESKRQLCRLLAELLCNVGKHAIGTTRLSVICQSKNQRYKLTVIDNGIGLRTTHEGDGTRFCHSVATTLNGKFTRRKRNNRGTICELQWSAVYPHLLIGEAVAVAFSLSKH